MFVNQNTFYTSILFKLPDADQISCKAYRCIYGDIWIHWERLRAGGCVWNVNLISSFWWVSNLKVKSDHLRFMSRVMEVETAFTRLLLEAWQVKVEWRLFRCNFSRCKIFLTFFSDVCSLVSSSKVLSCHHVTFGGGRPIKRLRLL